MKNNKQEPKLKLLTIWYKLLTSILNWGQKWLLYWQVSLEQRHLKAKLKIDAGKRVSWWTCKSI